MSAFRANYQKKGKKVNKRHREIDLFKLRQIENKCFLETYRWEFLIRKIWITDIIDLWVEVGDDFLGAHCVDLVF